MPFNRRLFMFLAFMFLFTACFPVVSSAHTTNHSLTAPSIHFYDPCPYESTPTTTAPSLYRETRIRENFFQDWKITQTAHLLRADQHWIERIFSREIASGFTVASKNTAIQNRIVGQEFDDYVAAKRLKGLDEAGQLGRQERLPTPDVPGRKYVQPDYTIYNQKGNVSAYADAKTGANIPFDAQSQGLVKWAQTTTSKTLIYYTPEGNTPINPKLLQYARRHGVRILQVAAP